MVSRGGQILLVNALSARQGGGQTYLLNLFHNLPSEFSQCHVICDSQNAAIFKNNQRLILHIVDNPGRSSLMRFLTSFLRVSRLIRRLQADVYFAPDGLLPFWPLPAKCRSVTVCQNMLPFSPKELLRFRSWMTKIRLVTLFFLQAISFHRSDLVIFISFFAREKVSKMIGLSFKKSIVVPHGISDHFLDPAPTMAPFNFPYVLYVSSFMEYKAHLEVLQSWKTVVERGLFDGKLVFMGHDLTDCAERVRAEIARQGLQETVLVGSETPYKDRPRFYRHAEVNLFASSCENCPNILLEALASKRPVFCSSYDPMPEFAKSHVWYFNPYNTLDLVQLFERYQEEKEHIMGLTDLAYEDVKSHPWEKASQEVFTAINGLS